MRLVLDTNVLISAMLSAGSTPGRVLTAVQLGAHDLLMSSDTANEFEAVIRRPKFDKYLSYEQRVRFWLTLQDKSLQSSVTSVVTDCPDPKDNMFLALALDARADLIVAGDKHLLGLHPWRGLPILTPSAFLDAYADPRA